MTRCCLCAVEQLVQTLNSDGDAITGVTSLAGEIYLLRWKERDHLEVYDVITYRLQRCLTVPNICGFTDMTSCEQYSCVYIGDYGVECVHRLDVQGAVTRWAVDDKPACLSVNAAAHSVIVTCPDVRKIKEFSSHGDLVREVLVPDDDISPWHAVPARSGGQFIVCHGGLADPVHRVYVMSADGRRIVHSHGGQPGSDTGQYNVPGHLAVDDNGSVFVADVFNRRVTLLSPTLEYVRQVLLGDQLKWWPYRLYLDSQQHLLYIAVNEWNAERRRYTAGRVVVFSV